MAEAEDVLTDAARHATIFARDLWHRHRPQQNPTCVHLRDVEERLGLLVNAVFDVHARLRFAQPPLPPTLLTRLFRREERPRTRVALPATDGLSIWLPAQISNSDQLAQMRYRCMALLQGVRIKRGTVEYLEDAIRERIQDIYLLLEARSSHLELAQLLPGMRQDLDLFRESAVEARPPLDAFPSQRQPFEQLVRAVMRGETVLLGKGLDASVPERSLEAARQLARTLEGHGKLGANADSLPRTLLFKDEWTGDVLLQSDARVSERTGDANSSASSERPKSSRLPRRPEVREASEDEDDAQAGAWMIQTAQPNERAEDPWGMQRPADRDEGSADEYADALSELSQARLVRSPGQAKEILLSDDPPEAQRNRTSQHALASEARYAYPEWDWRTQTYREPGAWVHVMPSQLGPMSWVTQTLRTHQSMCDLIRRRFEILRGARERLHRQREGEEIDLEAYVDARADVMARQPMPQNLYRTIRPARRDLAVTLLVDVSGSTDSWIANNRRVIDVEREALLLVCIALEGMREPYSVLAFSGEGPSRVTIRDIKTFEENYGVEIAQRIAALEPEQYTRAGAAIRHASSLLMKQPARHRLLLLLSDGKPNDQDEYDGRYGAEDMRQSVNEARLQGIFPFCLTIDRQAANYLPQVFGASHYALLPKPELLPTVLLEWIRRLLAH